MKIRNLLLLFAAALFMFLPLIGALAQTVQGDTNPVFDFLTEYGQYAYAMTVWVVGVLIKRYGDTVPFLNQLNETSYRVLAFGILLAIAFWKFGNVPFFEYIKTYGLAALIYLLGLRGILESAGDMLLGEMPKKENAK